MCHVLKHIKSRNLINTTRILLRIDRHATQFRIHHHIRNERRQLQTIRFYGNALFIFCARPVVRWCYNVISKRTHANAARDVQKKERKDYFVSSDIVTRMRRWIWSIANRLCAARGGHWEASPDSSHHRSSPIYKIDALSLQSGRTALLLLWSHWKKDDPHCRRLQPHGYAATSFIAIERLARVFTFLLLLCATVPSNQSRAAHP